MLKGPSSKSEAVLDTHASSGSFRSSSAPCYTFFEIPGWALVNEKVSDISTDQKNPAKSPAQHVISYYWVCYKKYFYIDLAPQLW